jgi:hypothetical protein
MTKLIAERGHKFFFAAMWVAIGLISAIDLYWAVKNQDTMIFNEENPIGRYLIRLDDGSVALFMGVKMAGTILALGFLIFLYHYKSFFAWVSIVILTMLQFYLLYYLEQ